MDKKLVACFSFYLIFLPTNLSTISIDLAIAIIQVVD